MATTIRMFAALLMAWAVLFLPTSEAAAKKVRRSRTSSYSNRDWRYATQSEISRAWRSGCSCDMCCSIRAIHPDPRTASNASVARVLSTPAQVKPVVKPAAAPPAAATNAASGVQAATNPETMRDIVTAMQIKPGDVAADLGGGNGDLACLMYEAGASRVYSIEIDPDLHAAAIKNIRDRGYGGKVIPVNEDLFDIDLKEYRINKAAAVLLSDTLEQLHEAGLFDGLDRVVTPHHHIEGLVQFKEGDLLVYDRNMVGIVPFAPVDYVPADTQTVAKSKPAPVVRKVATPSIQWMYFGATWCGGCRVVKPLIEKRGGVTMYDHDRHRAKFSEYGVTSMPYLIKVEGEKITGYSGTTAIKRALEL